MSVLTLEESFANFLAVNTKVSDSVPGSVLSPVLSPEPVDCPICMEVIVANKNIVITECGHTFHCSCLMKNVAHNGFGCPYCRTAMAEEIDNESSEYEGDESITDAVDASMHEDDMLRGFRMFHNLCDGIEHEQLDIDDEKYYEAYLDLNVIDQNINNSNQNQSNIVTDSNQESEWLFWDDVANTAAERDATVEWDANGNIWNDIANAAAQRDAERDALSQNNSTENQSNPNQETDWNNFASVAAAYRAAAQRADADRAAYCAANSIEYTEHDSDYYDDDDDERYSDDDGYREPDEPLWSDDDDGSHCGSEY